MFFLNDFGVSIQLNVIKGDCTAVDLSSSTAREFELQKPDGTIVTVSATFVTDGTDGRLIYTITAGVLNVIGTWSVRAKITEGGSRLYRTEKIEFEVRA